MAVRDLPPVPVKLDNFVREYYSAFNGTYDIKLVTQSKEFYYNVAKDFNYPIDSSSSDQTLKNFTDYFTESSVSLHVISFSGLPLSEEQHALFNATVDERYGMMGNFVLSLKGVEKLFDPEIQSKPIVQDYFKVVAEYFDKVAQFKDDSTGYYEYSKDPKTIQIQNDILYLLSKVFELINA
jgi:isocitrate lyase